VTAGTVTGLHRSITVSDGQGGSAHLADLIQTDASLEPGDSGGPLLDSAGRVIGMDAAADTDFRGGGSGFAIPINRAVSIVKVIRSGRTVGAVHVGPTSFLGISVSSAVSSGAASGGALVSGVLSGGPADKAGLASGDLITSLAGRSISSPTGLITALLATPPGKTVQIRWRDSIGYSHSGTIRPISGPPQ
jgi:S1-C subfamily serine protease